jgi:hypothetical protein
MDSIWRHRPAHIWTITTITLLVFIPQSWTFQLWEKIRFMRMPRKNEHADVSLRVRNIKHVLITHSVSFFDRPGKARQNFVRILVLRE